MKRIFTIVTLLLFTSCTQNNIATTEIEDTKSTLKRLAKKIKSNGDLQTALQLEAKLISLDEKDANSFIDLSKSLRDLKQNDEALSLLFKGEKINPQSEQIKLALAKSLVENDQPDAALGKLEEITQIRNSEYFNTKGIAFDMVDDYQSAQSTYREGLKISAKNGTLLNNLALSYLLNRKPSKAIPILEKLVKSPKAKDKYRHNLALAYGLNKQNKKAYNVLIKELSSKQAKENLKRYKDFR